MTQSDYYSIGSVNAINKFGYKIPDDVKIVGFDDLSMTEFLTPSLTTVHCSRFTLGSYATEHIISILEGSIKDQVIQTVFQPSLVIRSST